MRTRVLTYPYGHVPLSLFAQNDSPERGPALSHPVDEDGLMAWNPWRTLRSRAHITLYRTPLHGSLRGVYAPRGDRAVILLDSALGRRERAAILTHELVHDERGGGCDAEWMPATWAPIVVRDEATVDRIAALRLVPTDELRYWLTQQDGGVTAHDVAEAWDVTLRVASLSLAVACHPAAFRSTGSSSARPYPHYFD